jgi:perosamine synthetase
MKSSRCLAGPADPFPTWPQLDESDVEAVVEVLRSNNLSQRTSRTIERFEESFALYHGVKHAIAVSSGTAAIHLALHAVGVGPGDEVAVPAHTFVASASPICHLGATPVLVDVDHESYCLSVADLERKVSDRTRAVVVVHLNGLPADMGGVRDVAAGRGILVVEDAAQAVGARYGDRPVGSVGRLGCFSFWEDKVLTMGGEGGALTTDDDELAARIRRLRHHGEGPLAGTRLFGSHEPGYNYRATAMQAALGSSQLSRLDLMVERRRANADLLTERLLDVPGLHLPVEPPGRTSSWWKFVMHVDQAARRTAPQLVERLQARGIPAVPRYPVALSQQPGLVPLLRRDADCPVAERLSSELVTLPVHPAITATHVETMADAIRAELT